MMNGKQRIMAALRRQPVDRIPFVPLIDIYTLAEMPPSIPKTEDASGYGYAHGMLEACRAIGCDSLLRHVAVTAPEEHQTTYLDYLGPFDGTVQLSAERVGWQLRETLRTPAGTLTGVWGFTPEAGWIPHPLKYLVTNAEEMRIFHLAIDHFRDQTFSPDATIFQRITAELGNEGVATASLMNSPFMYLIEMAWGLENTYYLLKDHPAEVEEILAKLHAAIQRYVRDVLIPSPAEVIIAYENTSSTLLSRKVFQRYCLPHLNDYADQLAQAGKVFLVHMCGKLHAFSADIRDARFAGVADISPAPTGDLPLDQAAATLGGKVVIGGIDPTTFISPNQAAFAADLSRLIRAIRPYPGVLLGSADTAPRGTRVENLRTAMELVQTEGSYA